jgi:hypothetical protein
MHVNTLCVIAQEAIVPARVVYEARKPPKRYATTSTNDVDAIYYTCVIMPHGGDTLLKVCHCNWPFLGDEALPDRLDVQQKLINHISDLVDAASKVAGMCNELLGHGLCYVDLKKSNVLVDPKNHNQLFFCDYGAISPLSDGDACATYPPPDYPNGLKIEATQSVIVYGLGALLFCMLFPKDEARLRYGICKTIAEMQDHQRHLLETHHYVVHAIRCSENLLRTEESCEPPRYAHALSNLFEDSFNQEHSIESWREALRELSSTHIYQVLRHFVKVREKEGTAYFSLDK